MAQARKQANATGSGGAATLETGNVLGAPSSTTGRGGGSNNAAQAAQNEARYLDELGRLRVDRMRIEGDYSGSIDAKYKAILAGLDEELASFTRQVEADEGLTAAKRARLIAEKTAAIEAVQANAEQDRARDLAERTAALNEAELRAQLDIVSAKSQLAEGSKDRLRFELELFDLQERLRMAELDRVLATEATASAAWQAAKVQKEALEQSRGLRRSGVVRQNEGPLAAYARSLSPDRVDDRIEGLVIDELQSVRDSIRSAVEKATGIKDPLIGGLINLLIEQVLIRPIAEALSKQGGGGGGLGGFASTVIGSLFGRASGGSVMGGQMYRVNEGASPGRVEGFIPRGSGTIVPLGQMGALTRSGGAPRVFNVNVDARNSVTPAGFAQQLSAAILQQAAQMDAQTSARTLRAVPGRFDQFQRDGN